MKRKMVLLCCDQHNLIFIAAWKLSNLLWVPHAIHRNEFIREFADQTQLFCKQKKKREVINKWKVDVHGNDFPATWNGNYTTFSNQISHFKSEFIFCTFLLKRTRLFINKPKHKKKKMRCDFGVYALKYSFRRILMITIMAKKIGSWRISAIGRD